MLNVELFLNRRIYFISNEKGKAKNKASNVDDRRRFNRSRWVEGAEVGPYDIGFLMKFLFSKKHSIISLLVS